MSERLKMRKRTRFLYDDSPERVQIGEEEEIYEPVEVEAAPEFSGVVGTLSLPHGGLPPEPLSEWSVYKVYEKVVIWLHHAPKGVA